MSSCNERAIISFLKLPSLGHGATLDHRCRRSLLNLRPRHGMRASQMMLLLHTWHPVPPRLDHISTTLVQALIWSRQATTNQWICAAIPNLMHPPLPRILQILHSVLHCTPYTFPSKTSTAGALRARILPILPNVSHDQVNITTIEDSLSNFAHDRAYRGLPLYPLSRILPSFGREGIESPFEGSEEGRTRG